MTALWVALTAVNLTACLLSWLSDRETRRRRQVLSARLDEIRAQMDPLEGGEREQVRGVLEVAIAAGLGSPAAETAIVGLRDAYRESEARARQIVGAS